MRPRHVNLRPPPLPKTQKPNQRQYTRRETYTEQNARDLCKALVGAIKYCHDRGVVHRDLKPENLLLSSPSDGASVKLADFGLACSVLDGPAEAWCGTAGYMAPEIITRRPYGTVRLPPPARAQPVILESAYMC